MRLLTSVYVLLLGYIIAIIIFWGISLERQSQRIYNQELMTLTSRVDSIRQPEQYTHERNKLRHQRGLRTKQYLGEGGLFLLIIFIGAAAVYTSFLRNLRLSRQQSNFMLSVTHELKSPIAAMKLSLQTLERHQLDEKKQGQILASCIAEANRLNELCNNMLVASQIEGRFYKPVKEKLDLSELVQESVERYRTRYPKRFMLDIAESCTVTGDKLMLQMMVNNLLENAVKYSPADKKILVRLKTKQEGHVIEVADQGPGIPDAQKRKIFQKFYRIGNEETRKAKGTGLGLYLVNRIVAGHKGKITVADNTPTGAIFEILLPRVD
jgi:signal transduction histidine kinase